MLCIVPNQLRDELYRRIDAQLAVWPELLPEREKVYGDLLLHFDEHGVIPDFDLSPRESAIVGFVAMA